MAILINGNGNPAIYAAQDADLIASLAGNTTGIAKVGNEFSYTAEDANTISVADGVIVTKEGRRIQLDAGENDIFTIPAGTAGVTNYYIIGYHLHENASGQQVADTFVQLMASATDTIQEDTLRGGASDVYVSLYRVEQDGVNLGTITLLLPKLANISQVNNDLPVSITRSGTTFTVKNSAGETLFTFDQQDSDTTTGTTYNAGSCPDNTTFATNGSVKNVFDNLNAYKKVRYSGHVGGVITAGGWAEFSFQYSTISDIANCSITTGLYTNNVSARLLAIVVGATTTTATVRVFNMESANVQANVSIHIVRD